MANLALLGTGLIGMFYATSLTGKRAKVQKLVARALEPPRARRLTRPGPGAIERRLRTKRVRSNVKRQRAAADDDEA